jgi:hypothetical protein
MVPRGLEPRTLRLLAVRSNQLSYETVARRRPAGQRKGPSAAARGAARLLNTVTHARTNMHALRNKQTDTDRQTDSLTDTHRQTHPEKERETDRERARERERERKRERGSGICRHTTSANDKGCSGN